MIKKLLQFIKQHQISYLEFTIRCYKEELDIKIKRLKELKQNDIR